MTEAYNNLNKVTGKFLKALNEINVKIYNLDK